MECDCLSFECVDTFKRHVRFHAFHTKLKQIGQNVLKTLEEKKKDSEDNNDQQPVPKCNLEELTRNIIPELPLKFECGWSNCNHGTDNPELFYRHIKVKLFKFFCLKVLISDSIYTHIHYSILTNKLAAIHFLK